MKTISFFLSILLINLLAACQYESRVDPRMEYLKSARHSLDYERGRLKMLANTYNEDCDKYDRARADFVESLNDEQLAAYSQLLNASNEADFMLKGGILGNLLSEEQKTTHLKLRKQKRKLSQFEKDYASQADSWARKSQSLNQSVRFYAEQLQYQDQVRIQNQQLWHNYYNNQQLQQSLRGIQGSINQLQYQNQRQGNIKILPPPTSAY